MSGGEARKLTAFPGRVDRQFPLVAGRPVAGRQLPAARPAADRAGPTKDRKEQGLSDPPRVIDDLLYRLDGDGYFGGAALWLVPGGRWTETRRLRRLLLPSTGEQSWHRLLYGKDTRGAVSTFRPTRGNWSSRPIARKSRRCTLEGRVAADRRGDGPAMRISGLPPGPKIAVCWSPDGKTIAYAGRIGNDPPTAPRTWNCLCAIAVRGGARSLTAEHDVCLQAEGITDIGRWSLATRALQFSPDGRRIYMRLSVRGESHVASVSSRGGQLAFHTRGALDVRMGNLSHDGRRWR